jgi:ferredoxin-thioredoxin reductase catalytic subunit
MVWREQKKYNLTVTGVFQGVQMVYVPLMPGHDSRLPKKCALLLFLSSFSLPLSACPCKSARGLRANLALCACRLRRLITREKGQKYVDLIVTFENDDGSDVNGPPVRYWLTSKRKKVVKKKSSPQTPESS